MGTDGRDTIDADVRDVYRDIKNRTLEAAKEEKTQEGGDANDVIEETEDNATTNK